MMRPLCLSIVIATTALPLFACDNGAKDESAAALARDSSLAHDLRLAAADTVPFRDAADVAVAQRSDSTVRVVDSIPMSSPASARVVSNDKSDATVTESSGSVASSNGTSAEPKTSPTPMRTTTSRATTATSSARSTDRAATRASEGPSAEDFAGPSCASPALADQRRCLLSYLARSDLALDRNYQALITALKREAGAPARGTEPATVLRLRTAQRNWLVYRDNECRRRNEGKEGPLWAPTRAQCLAEYSEERAKELANALESRRSSTKASNAKTTTKAAKQTTSRSTKRDGS